MDTLFKAISIFGLTLLTAYCVSGKMCSYNKAKPVTSYKVVHKPCTKAVQKLCAWYSLSYCTFYEITSCKFESNSTHYTYHTIVDCCKGYAMAPNGSCVDLIQAQNEQWYINNQNATTEGSIYVDPADIVTIAMPTETDAPETRIAKVTDKDNGMSHGVYAAIACVLLFIGVVLVLSIIAVRKRRRRRLRKEDDANSQRAALQTDPEET